MAIGFARLAADEIPGRGVWLRATQDRGPAMRSTQQFSITLPNEMAEAVRAKVACGEYATESEVIQEGLRALLARDRAIVHGCTRRWPRLTMSFTAMPWPRSRLQSCRLIRRPRESHDTRPQDEPLARETLTPEHTWRPTPEAGDDRYCDGMCGAMLTVIGSR